MKFLATLLMLVLSACSIIHWQRTRFLGTEIVIQNPPLYWAFACDFPNDKQQIVREAFDYWNGLAGKELFEETSCHLRDTLQDQDLMLTILAADKWPDQGPEVWAITSGVNVHGNFIGGKMVFLHPWLAKPEEWLVMASVARHEVGHVIGFDHSTREDCLMYEYVNGAKDYSDIVKGVCPEEWAAFRERYKP